MDGRLLRFSGPQARYYSTSFYDAAETLDHEYEEAKDIVDASELATDRSSAIATSAISAQRTRGRVVARWHFAGTENSDEQLDRISAAIDEEELVAQRRVQDVTRRLVALESAFFDDSGHGLDCDSKAGFECFMKFNSSFGIPLLGAESRGHIVATWRRAGQCLSVRFVSRYHIDYAVSQGVGEDQTRQWGKSTLATFPSEHPEWKQIAVV